MVINALNPSSTIDEEQKQKLLLDFLFLKMTKKMKIIV